MKTALSRGFSLGLAVALLLVFERKKNSPEHSEQMEMKEEGS